MKPIRIMVGGALIDAIEQSCPDSFLVRNVDNLAGCTHFMDDLTKRVIGNTTFNTPMAPFVKMHVDRIVVGVRFERH